MYDDLGHLGIIFNVRIEENKESKTNMLPIHDSSLQHWPRDEQPSPVPRGRKKERKKHAATVACLLIYGKYITL